MKKMLGAAEAAGMTRWGGRKGYIGGKGLK